MEKNITKINKGKYRVWDGVILCSRTGSWLLESSFAGRDVGVLIGSKCNSSQQCASAAKKATCLLGCNSEGIAVGAGKRLFPSLALGQSVQIQSHHF